MRSPTGWFRMVAPCAAAALAACSDTTGANSSRLQAADVVGTWSITLRDTTPPCADPLPSAPVTLQVTGQDSDVEPFGSLNFTNVWNADTARTGTVYGTMNLQTRSAIWHLTRIDSTGNHGLELTGSVDVAGAINGVVSDPYANYLPLLVTDRCTRAFTATRTGA